MHGLIHLELRKFVEANYGAPAWTELVQRAKVDSEIYTPVASYPDEQMMALVTEAVKLTGLSATALLEAFGEFLVGAYLSLYGALLKPEWKTLDVLENTEETIHRVVRLRHAGAEPPRLKTKRTGPKEVVLTYDSPRRLCAVARGIALGVSKRFGEKLSIDESKCMRRGDPACIVTFRTA